MPQINAIHNSYRPSGSSASKLSHTDPVCQSRHEVHALMKNCHDQGGCTLTRQAKNIVMFAPCHPQRGIQVAHVPEIAFPGGKAGNALLQIGNIVAHLCSAPLLASVADDTAQVGFRLCRENVRRQLRCPSSSSSRISPTVLVDTLPASPSLIRFPRRVFSSCHA